MKRYVTVMIAAAMLLTLAGCSENTEEEKANAQSAEVQQTEYVMQEGDYQVTGEVTAIVGNEVTLALGEVTETKNSFGQAPGDNESAENADGEEAESGERAGKGERPDMSGSEDGEMPERGSFGGGEKPDISSSADGEMPERGDFGGGERPDMSGFESGEASGGEGFGRNGGGAGSGSAEITKSGETGVYIIPYGMTLTGKSRNSDYTSITEGTILRLTITSEGYVAAAEIL